MSHRLFKQRILWNAMTVEVLYEPYWLDIAGVEDQAMAHLQIRSLDPVGAALPLSETGYLSHYLPAAIVLDAGGPLCFVRAWLTEEAVSRHWTPPEEAPRHYSLL